MANWGDGVSPLGRSWGWFESELRRVGVLRSDWFLGTEVIVFNLDRSVVIYDRVLGTWGEVVDLIVGQPGASSGFIVIERLDSHGFDRLGNVVKWMLTVASSICFQGFQSSNLFCNNFAFVLRIDGWLCVGLKSAPSVLIFFLIVKNLDLSNDSLVSFI